MVLIILSFFFVCLSELPQRETKEHIIFFYYRGFGFITFADPASVDKVLAQGTHELDGKKVKKKKTHLNILLNLSFFAYAFLNTH